MEFNTRESIVYEIQDIEQQNGDAILRLKACRFLRLIPIEFLTRCGSKEAIEADDPVRF